MIPQRSHGLSVGVVIVFELAGVCSVFSPAIERRSTKGAMQMYRRWTVILVYKADDRLSSSCHVESRARCHAIISNICGGV